MIVTKLGVFLIPIIAIMFILLSLKKALMLTFILSTFTTLSVVYISKIDYSITVGYYSGMLLIIKVVVDWIRKKIKIPHSMPILPFIFVIICTISLLYPKFYSEGVVVLTPNNSYEPIRFNIQMLTQYLYLLFGIIMLYIAYIIYKNSDYTEDNFINVQKHLAYCFIIFLVLQLFMPIEQYNSLFRNTTSFNDQTINGMIRLSGPTMEASVLCMICVPALAVLILSNKKKIKIENIVISIILLILIFTTKSSTLVIGLAIIVIYLLNSFAKNLIKNKEINKVLLISFILFFIMFIILSKYVIADFSDILSSLFEKVQGENLSGQSRLAAFNYHIDVFKKHWLVGVGFGTVRSYDLLSGWLASIGILGVIVFLYMVFRIIKNLFFENKGMLLSVFILLNIVIMFISVPEPYYIYIWIALGIGEGIYTQIKDEKVKFR